MTRGCCCTSETWSDCSAGPLRTARRACDAPAPIREPCNRSPLDGNAWTEALFGWTGALSRLLPLDFGPPPWRKALHVH